MPVVQIGTQAAKVEVTSPAIVIGHADADGHLAAEQSRTNLQMAGIDVSEVCVTAATRNYQFWERTFPALDLEGVALVVVVDIAFSFRDPRRSLHSILETVDRNTGTQFIIIDHHPIRWPSLQRLNLMLFETPSPYDCCLGKPCDELMVVAAICDGGRQSVKSRTSPEFEKRALGVRRAAADLDGLMGSRLLSLLRCRDWGFFESLADEPREAHRNVRGRRVAGSSSSPLLDSIRTSQISVHPTQQPAR